MVLPYIKMNPPQVYMCPPSWTLLPPPSPYQSSGSYQCNQNPTKQNFYNQTGYFLEFLSEGSHPLFLSWLISSFLWMVLRSSVSLEKFLFLFCCGWRWVGPIGDTTNFGECSVVLLRTLPPHCRIFSIQWCYCIIVTISNALDISTCHLRKWLLLPLRTIG